MWCLATVVVTTSLVVVSPSAATLCAPSIWDASRDLDADVIFSGDVISQDVRDDLQVPPFTEVRIDVERVWKGDPRGRVTVIVQPSSSAISDDDVVAANATEQFGIGDVWVSVGDCGGRSQDELRAALTAADYSPRTIGRWWWTPATQLAAGVFAATFVGLFLLSLRGRTSADADR
jgi:hypothetical protein